MKVCVTGCNGFIGRHVVTTLTRAGQEVVGIDILKGPSPMAEFLSWDVTETMPKISGLDAVIHLAAIAHPRDGEANPPLAFNVNVNGTHQVLRMAHESGAQKVLFASSAHVYGIPPKYLPTDEHQPVFLHNNYTITKILGEQLCDLYYRTHGLSYVVLRLFNAYGPDQGRGYFIPDMVSQAKAGYLELLAGDTTKDFIHVDDVAGAFLAALSTSFVGPVNIGSGVETPLKFIAEAIAKRYRAPYHISQRLATPTRMQAHIGRAGQILGWQPTVDITEAIDGVLSGLEAAV